jgi:hypothetical protein
MGATRPGDMPTGTAKLRPDALSSSLAPDPLCSWKASESGASFAGTSMTASRRLPAVPDLASALVTRPVLALLLLPGGSVMASGASHFAGEVR